MHRAAGSRPQTYEFSWLAEGRVLSSAGNPAKLQACCRDIHPMPAVYHYEWHPRMPPQVAQPREGYLMSATGVALGLTLILAGVLNLLGTS